MTIVIRATPAPVHLFSAETERLASRPPAPQVRRLLPPLPTRHVCPTCGGPTTRAAATLLDRIVALVERYPRRRWRCRVAGCGWSGTLTLREGHPRRD